MRISHDLYGVGEDPLILPLGKCRCPRVPFSVGRVGLI